MQGLFDRFETAAGTIAELTPTELQLVETAVVIAVIVLVRWLVLFVVRRRIADARVRYSWRKGVTYTLGMIALFLIGRVWFEGFRSIATFLGLVGAGLAIALKEPVLNLAGWLFLLWRRPFVVGDRIQISGNAGDVIDVRLFQFTLLEIGNWVDADQSTGRLIHVPNARVFTDPVANYTRGFPYIWNEVPVRITFESDWQAAKDLLQAIANRHAEPIGREAEKEILSASRRFLIFYSTLTPTVYTRVGDSGPVLTIRYLCEARRRRGTEQAIWEDVLRTFGERDDIAFAYPTRRFYRPPDEEPA